MTKKMRNQDNVILKTGAIFINIINEIIINNAFDNWSKREE